MNKQPANDACESFHRFHRRSCLRLGGTAICGLGLLDVLAAQSKAAPAVNDRSAAEPKAKQMIVVWLAGGPPHIDMFDMKPEAPAEYRGEFKPIHTNLPGLDICELMPNLARMADKFTIIRSVTTLNNPGDHSRAPMYWLTGNPRLPSGTDEFPMFGSVVSKLRPGAADLPTFAVLGKIDHHIGNAISGSFLGSAYSPFIFDPTQSGDDMARMLQPQLELPAQARDVELLAALDGQLRRADAQDALIAALDAYQQTAFNMLASPRLREAVDLSREDPRIVDRYARCDPPEVNYVSYGNSKHFLLARRLIEAGVPVVHFSLGYWDWHGGNFTSGRKQIPALDAALSTLLEELDERGLLETTIVLALGEMGRKPQCGTQQGAGRDHWDYAQFVLAAGGGFRRGAVVGATDKLAEQVTDGLYKVESFGRTLYHLLGIDPDTVVNTLNNRPVRLIAEDAPLIREALA